MHRYLFDLIDTESATHVNGGMLDDDDQAKRLAIELAQEVREERPELIGRGYEIRVRGEQGNEISRVSIDRLPRGRDGFEREGADGKT